MMIKMQTDGVDTDLKLGVDEWKNEILYRAVLYFKNPSRQKHRIVYTFLLNTNVYLQKRKRDSCRSTFIYITCDQFK